MRSCRSLSNLERVVFVNYKEIYERSQGEEEDEYDKKVHIKMELEWRAEPKFGNIPVVTEEKKTQ